MSSLFWKFVSSGPDLYQTLKNDQSQPKTNKITDSDFFD